MPHVHTSPKRKIAPNENIFSGATIRQLMKFHRCLTRRDLQLHLLFQLVMALYEPDSMERREALQVARQQWEVLMTSQE